MTSLGSKSSSNILIRKRIRTRKETNTAEIQGTTHSRQDIQLAFLHPDIWANQEQALNRLLETIFMFPTTTSVAQNLIQFMISTSLVKSIWVKKEKDHILMTKSHLKILISTNFRKLCWVVIKINAPWRKLSVWNFDCQIKFWMSIWRPRSISKFCKVLWKFPKGSFI